MLKRWILVCVLIGSSGCRQAEIKQDSQVPYWLTDFQDVYQESPSQAARQWFREAKSGLFVHLNLASLCERGKTDYLLWNEGKAPDRLLHYVGVSRQDYEAASNKDTLLFDHYALERFDADAICRLAKAAHMKYITFTTIHLGRCFNFKTRESEFNSLNAPCQRDLAGDLAKACQRHGLALFFYVPPEYAQTKDPEQTRHNRAVLTELLTQYGPIAGIWFDGIGNFYKNPEFFAQTKETFAMIRKLQPHALISFKEGGLCDEDFISPEHFMLPFDWEFDTAKRQARYQIRKDRWGKQNATRWQQHNQTLLREVNTVMQACTNRDGLHVPSGWINDESARHLTAEEFYYWLKYSRYTGSNLLMNIGPRADGSIHPDDVKAFTEVGKLIEQRGWPPVVHGVPLFLAL
ncbi:MAG: alpha-L-fucosidase [Phycisphaeraceae bacterium]|nr:alpha-L-fucosidase [Phycisphaeraceae bacterium]